jgi:hypothetical protein
MVGDDAAELAGQFASKRKLRAYPERIYLQHNMFKLTFLRTGLYRQQDTT